MVSLKFTKMTCKVNGFNNFKIVIQTHQQASTIPSSPKKIKHKMSFGNASFEDLEVMWKKKEVSSTYN